MEATYGTIEKEEYSFFSTPFNDSFLAQLWLSHHFSALPTVLIFSTSLENICNFQLQIFALSLSLIIHFLLSFRCMLVIRAFLSLVFRQLKIIAQRIHFTQFDVVYISLVEHFFFSNDFSFSKRLNLYAFHYLMLYFFHAISVFVVSALS